MEYFIVIKVVKLDCGEGPTPMSERTCNAIAHVTINNYIHKAAATFHL